MSELMKMNSADMMIRMYLFIDVNSLFLKRRLGVIIIGQRYNNSMNCKGRYVTKNPVETGFFYRTMFVLVIWPLLSDVSRSGLD